MQEVSYNCLYYSLPLFYAVGDSLRQHYDSIFHIPNWQNNKGEGKNKAAESQKKERGSELKTMSNEFIDSVLDTARK